MRVRADPSGSLEFVGALKHLLSQIAREVRMVGEVLMHDVERVLGGLTAEERAEP